MRGSRIQFNTTVTNIIRLFPFTWIPRGSTVSQPFQPCTVSNLTLSIYCKLCTWQQQLFPSFSLDPPAEGFWLPQVVPAAKDEVRPGVEGGAHPAQAAVTAGTLQAVLVPVPVQRLQHEAVPDLPVAAGTAPRLLSGLEGHQRHTWQEIR